MSQSILLVEDDAELGKQIVATLRSAGFEVEWHVSAEPPFDPDYSRFQLVLLDLMLPGTYGLDVLKSIRESSDIPVMIVSARDDSVDVVRGLKLGADDYLRKPFWPKELVARVQARLRRASGDTVLRSGDVQIDLAARTVHVDRAAISLTRVEFDLLAALAKRAGVAVSRAWLNEHVLGDEDSEHRALDVHLSRIRKKIGAHHIVTVHGVGYRFGA